MAATKPRYTNDVPFDIEERAWAGTRWLVRKRTFAHVLGVHVEDGIVVALAFRAAGEEVDVLRNAGHPFFVLGWAATRSA